MPANEVAVHLHTWMEIGVASAGFIGVGLTAWRSNIGTKNEVRGVKLEVARLATAQEMANGRLRDVELECARNHSPFGYRHVPVPDPETEG